MAHQANRGEQITEPRVLPHAPADLTRGRLVRLGEGIGKVVYASEHWVVKRKRHPSEVVALILVWKVLRKVDGWLPGGMGRRLLERPGKRIRFLRLLLQAFVLTVPKGVWFTTHIGQLWRTYTSNEALGAMLANEHLAGTKLIPDSVTFPPTRVKVGRWPGWLVVSEASERVETTLHDRINELARARRFDEIEVWLKRFLDLRTAGWQRGVFSLDAHLKNFGVTSDRVVLLDSGGLTNRWREIENRLDIEDDITSPHVQLGLEMTLRDRPDIAQRFDSRWRATVNLAAVRTYWPDHPEDVNCAVGPPPGTCPS
jgi:hypothetical protein